MNKRFNDYLSSLTPKRRDIAAEAVKTFLAGESENVNRVLTSTDIYTLCRDMALLDVEHFDVLLMNNNYKLLKRFTVATGGFTEVAVDVRVIMREACLNNATILAAVHNHPSGSLSPSRADDQLTDSINKACQIMRIRFIDHVIIGDGNYYSYKECGKL